MTAVCSGTSRRRSIGADRVIDYTERTSPNGDRYDLILDTAGSHPWSDYKRVLDGKELSSPATEGNRWIGPGQALKPRSARSPAPVVAPFRRRSTADLLALQKLRRERENCHRRRVGEYAN